MNIRSKWINYHLVMDHFSVPRLPNEDNFDSLKPSMQRVSVLLQFILRCMTCSV